VEIEAMNKILAFLNEVRTELKKVTWPTRDELVGSTIIVCILVSIFAVILGGMDATFSAFIHYLTRF
jgi:preprotein translocase subunit SecE